MDDSRSAVSYFDQHRPRVTAVIPVLKAMSGELLAQVGEEQLRALFRATGAQIGESYPVAKIERLGELEQVARTWLAANDWGWLKIEHHEDAVDFVHGDSPLVAWFGGPNVSVGVSIGGPSVGWVPLGPREIYHPTYQVTNIYVRNVNSPYQRWHGPNPR